MGCDIHVFIEKKIDEKYDTWEAVQLYKIDQYSHKLEVVNPYDGRNYGLFSALAGVRGWEEPFISPRGLPKNLSREIEKEEAWWGEDAHTRTWYDLFELQLFIKEYVMKDSGDEEIILALEDFFDSLISYLHFAGEFIFKFEPNKYRIIMWFDS